MKNKGKKMVREKILSLHYYVVIKNLKHTFFLIYRVEESRVKYFSKQLYKIPYRALRIRATERD